MKTIGRTRSTNPLQFSLAAIFWSLVQLAAIVASLVGAAMAYIAGDTERMLLLVMIGQLVFITRTMAQLQHAVERGNR